MASIEIQKLSRTQKNYLKNLFNYKFESLFQLLFELFDSHKHGHKEIFEIEALLAEIGYGNLNEIPKNETEEIKKLIRSKLQEWDQKSDFENLSYKLMSQIQSKNIIVILDNKVIEHIENPIIINPNSVISFIDNSKLDSITFTTL
ncbi:hypothetical protein SGQ44_17015 [Flavobacterium sp. Fl-77]|uniref:Uncharacterized protein n=1 Tax=Flavobacterium flavipigmentatum TaxID=2893884 RepID=A0AAJ2SGG0_9FLAO|nr:MULTISPECIES: hypothetical protein [unclassified Flavobacterium]MDX6183972.1 hypothetical protein [Flavobacterium sp. Fl-33]MDX6187462.1 hypothetical protein [Flavobacterium sp. Fl-77]UFH37697.1 hypothetical protein LNP22_13230 [Flavobacterium sp. F-70]